MAKITDVETLEDLNLPGNGLDSICEIPSRDLH